MFLFRTTCNIDYKGRPNHMMVLVAKTENRRDAITMMNQDVANWMAVDIASLECCEADETEEEVDESQRVEDIQTRNTPAEILKMWTDGDSSSDDEWARFEMDLAPVLIPNTDTRYKPDHREFVQRTEGDVYTIVYHFLGDDYKYTSTP